MEFSSDAVAVIGFATLFGLMLLRVPVGMAMGLVGVAGFGYLTGAEPALKMVGQTSMRIVTDYTFGVIPMFLLMGAFVSRSGMTREIFRAANTFVGHWKAGLGLATIAACAGFAALKDIWVSLALLLFVIGGFFTPTEAGGMGAGGAFLIGFAPAAAMFTVLIGAILFGYFLTVTQTPQNVTAFITGLGLGRYGVLVVIMGMYLILGCLMDAMAMIILTVPIIFPVITELGFDPVWFGVIIVMTVELGLIHPPVGMNVFVIKTVVKDVSFSTIFMGVLPFVATDLVRLAILIVFPVIALWLPSRM